MRDACNEPETRETIFGAYENVTQFERASLWNLDSFLS